MSRSMQVVTVPTGSIRAVVLPAVVFTTAELVAKILHWSKFSVGTAPFTVWFLSYVLPPPIYLAAYLWHQRRATPDHVTDPLPRRLRTVMLALGAFLTADSLFRLRPPEPVHDVVSLEPHTSDGPSVRGLANVAGVKGWPAAGLLLVAGYAVAIVVLARTGPRPPRTPSFAPDASDSTSRHPTSTTYGGSIRRWA